MAKKKAATAAVESDDDAFQAAIAAAPDDDAPRLVYEDWLRERGRDADADEQRHQVHCNHAQVQVQAFVDRLGRGHGCYPPASVEDALEAAEEFLLRGDGFYCGSSTPDPPPSKLSEFWAAVIVLLGLRQPLPPDATEDDRDDRAEMLKKAEKYVADGEDFFRCAC